MATPPLAVAAMDELFRQSWSRLVRIATVLVGSTQLAEEIVQESFVELAKREDAIANPGAYLRVTVVNRCRNQRRRFALERLRRPPPPRLTVEDPVLDEMWELLTRLSIRRRAALVLRFYEDLPVDEIARILDCRPGTVSSLINRGLADLREVLES